MNINGDIIINYLLHACHSCRSRLLQRYCINVLIFVQIKFIHYLYYNHSIISIYTRGFFIQNYFPLCMNDFPAENIS